MTVRITKSSLNKVIKEVFVHNRNINECLIEALLREALDWNSVVSDLIEDGKSIAEYSVSGEDYIMVISIGEDDQLKVDAAAIGYTEGDWWRLHLLYSDDVSSTPMALLGALALHKKVIPDLQVSPEAQALVKGYYQKSKKSDPGSIEDNADPQRIKSGEDENKPWLRAGYYPPTGTESNILAAKNKGNAVVKKVAKDQGKKPEEVLLNLAKTAKGSFSAAYSSSERTGMDKLTKDVDNSLLKKLFAHQFISLSDDLLYVYKHKGSKKSWIPEWVGERQEEIKKAIADFLIKDQDSAYQAIKLINVLNNILADPSEENISDYKYTLVEDILDIIKEKKPKFLPIVKNELSAIIDW